MKNNTGKYMKPHEKVLYTLALVFGALLVVGGIVMLIIGGDLFVWGIILIAAGVAEAIGVGLLLWTDGEKRKKK